MRTPSLLPDSNPTVECREDQSTIIGRGLRAQDGTVVAHINIFMGSFGNSGQTLRNAQVAHIRGWHGGRDHLD